MHKLDWREVRITRYPRPLLLPVLMHCWRALRQLQRTLLGLLLPPAPLLQPAIEQAHSCMHPR